MEPHNWTHPLFFFPFSSSYRQEGYYVSEIRVASQSIVVAHLRHPDIAAWAIVTHGAEGVIWTQDPPPENLDEESPLGLHPNDGNNAKHHKLSIVILYVCEAKQLPEWRDMISREGTIWWTTGRVKMWTDWYDLDWDRGR